jgi:hypothetical protein
MLEDIEGNLGDEMKFVFFCNVCLHQKLKTNSRDTKAESRKYGVRQANFKLSSKKFLKLCLYYFCF